MSRRTCGGKLFHTRGPAALKLRSPKLLCVRGTTNQPLQQKIVIDAVEFCGDVRAISMSQEIFGMLVTRRFRIGCVAVP